jgi:AmiR/NasT family two-component response regulator
MTDKAEILERMAIRQTALDAAKAVVDPAVERFPPEEYRVTHAPAVVFSQAAGTTVTPVETVLNQYMAVADWLLEDRD